MRRPYDHPGRGEPIPRHDLSPPHGYSGSYGRPTRDFRPRDGPSNHYPPRAHGHPHGYGRSISPRPYRGPPPVDDRRYYNSRQSPERWGSPGADFRRPRDRYDSMHDRDRVKSRFTSDRDYHPRYYNYDRRRPYDDHPSMYSSRTRDSNDYYRKPMVDSYRDGQNHPCKVFVGNIPLDTTVDELKAVFEKCGELVKCDMRKRFAFLEYSKAEDASEALKQLDGYTLHGEKIKVKPHNEVPSRFREKIPLVKHHKTGYAITVANIEETTSWQDLKDFGRLAGEVNYASIVIKDGKKYGVIEYLSPESAKNALVELQGKKISNNKLEITEGSIIGKQVESEPNDTNDIPSGDRKRFRDDETSKDFDDDAQVVDYKSE